MMSIGTLLQDSGWTLAEVGIASTGTAESFLIASSITRTRQMHQITDCCLHKVMKTAYSDYCIDIAVSSDEVQISEAWCDSHRQQSTQFQFRHLVLSMELASQNQNVVHVY